jgi:uroporphyrinogen decarboxylase
VGYESLCMMQYLDPDLFRDLFLKIGELYSKLWSKMVKEYSDIFVFFRMGDDLGHRTSTMLEPDTIRQFIFPVYKKIIDIVHSGGKKFLLHSCGNIFDLMPDIIRLGIDAKHSNEDQIAPYEKWINLYGNQIGLFGGFDMNELILNDYESVFEKVRREATQFRSMTLGYGAGSGNSIPEYMSIEGFKGMVDAVKAIRIDE